MDERRRGELVRLALGVVLVVMLVAFIVDNSHSVTVGLVFTDRRLPLIWVLLITALVGVVADRLLQVLWRRRH